MSLCSTVWNSPAVNHGAGALLLASDAVERVAPRNMGVEAPAPRKLIGHVGGLLTRRDVIELSEAFAAQMQGQANNRQTRQAATTARGTVAV